MLLLFIYKNNKTSQNGEKNPSSPISEAISSDESDKEEEKQFIATPEKEKSSEKSDSSSDSSSSSSNDTEEEEIPEIEITEGKKVSLPVELEVTRDRDTSKRAAWNNIRSRIYSVM